MITFITVNSHASDIKQTTNASDSPVIVGNNNKVTIIHNAIDSKTTKSYEKQIQELKLNLRKTKKTNREQKVEIENYKNKFENINDFIVREKNKPDGNIELATKVERLLQAGKLDEAIPLVGQGAHGGAGNLTVIATKTDGSNKRNVVEVTALDSKDNVVILNSGDDKVFISHISMTSKELGHSSTILLNKTIEGRSFLTQDLKAPQEDLTEWATGNYTEAFWQKMLTYWHLSDNECVSWHFYCPDDPTYQTIKTFMGNGFRSVPIDATLFSRSTHDGHLVNQDFKVFGVPYLKRSEACGAPNGWIPSQKRTPP